MQLYQRVYGGPGTAQYVSASTVDEQRPLRPDADGNIAATELQITPSGL